MPNIDVVLPDLSPKPLKRRIQRALKFVSYEQIEAIPNALRGLRKLSHKLLLDFDKTDKIGERVAIAGIFDKLQERRRVLLRIPGPPAGAQIKSANGHAVIEAEPVVTSDNTSNESKS